MSDGPNPEHLRRLFGMLPTYVKAVQDRKLGFKKPIDMAKPTARICTICGRGHEHRVNVEGCTMFCMNCAPCQQNLELGYTALRSPDHRYAFVKHADLEPGKVFTVSQEVMNRVQEKYDQASKKES